MQKIQSMLLGMLVITGMFFLGGCNEITKETEVGFVSIQEQTKEWNQETCGTYKMKYQKIKKENQDLFLKDCIKPEKEYQVFWYEKEKEEMKQGDEILQSFPEEYNHSYIDKNRLDICKHCDSAETVCVYNESHSMFYWTPIGFGTASLMNHIDRIFQNSMLEQEWEFASRESIKEQAQSCFERYGIQVAETMDIYAVSKEKLLDYHVEEWEKYVENTGDTEALEKKKNIQLIEDFYLIKAYIMADGIRVIDNLEVSYLEDEAYIEIPELTLIYTKDGVQQIIIRNYMQLGEKIEEQEILSYEEAKEILLGQYEGVESETEHYEYLAGELVYLPQEEKGELIAIPVWQFKGTKTKEYEGVEYESDCTVLIDAYTGEFIQ